MPLSPYSRYHGLPGVELDGSLSLTQRPPVAARAPADSLSHTLVGGETLEKLAAHYYGRADLWWRIADANPGRFPLDWQPGDVVVIPPIRTATRVARR